jgi:hypothetical protein
MYWFCLVPLIVSFARTKAEPGSNGTVEEYVKCIRKIYDTARAYNNISIPLLIDKSRIRASYDDVSGIINRAYCHQVVDGLYDLVVHNNITEYR